MNSIICNNGTLRCSRESGVVFDEGVVGEEGFRVDTLYQPLERFPAEDVELLNTFMKEIFPSEPVRNFMYNWMATLIGPPYYEGRFLIWKGDGANGKTTFMRLLSRLFSNNVAPICTANMVNRDRCVEADNNNKKLFYILDNNTKRINTFNILRVLERPCIKDLYSVGGYVQNIILEANELPQMTKTKAGYDTRFGFRYRLHVVPFNQQFMRKGGILMRSINDNEIERMVPVLLSQLVEHYKATYGELTVPDEINNESRPLIDSIWSPEEMERYYERNR